MKLYATTTSERASREVKKGAEEYIKTRYTNKGIHIFEVTFKDDGEKRGLLEIMDYSNGKTRIIKYMEE